MSENKIFKGKSILFVSPVFFGYEAAIKNKLIELGADVTYVDDRPSNNSFFKGVVRVYKKILDDTILKYYAQVTDDIADREFDIVFLLNPEAMPLSFLEMCKSRWQNALVVMYMWDSITSGTLRERESEVHAGLCALLRLPLVGFRQRVLTFDKGDAALHKFDFRPLFYLDLYSAIRQEAALIKYDLCFMGTAHSDRYSIVKSIKEWCDANELRCYFYLYMQNKTFYYVNKLTKKNGDPSTALVARFAFEEISFTKRSAAEIVDVVRSSRAVLDIQHFKQTGLTMRTLETLGAGKKLITTNPEVKEYDFYDERRVMVIDRSNPAAALDLEFFREDDRQVSDAVIDSYSTAADGAQASGVGWKIYSDILTIRSSEVVRSW